MDAFECPVCLESIYYSKDRVMLFSDVCKHRLCDHCVELHFGQLGRGQCPTCRAPVTRQKYTDREPESLDAINEREARRRVVKILNDPRCHFENTPLYNDYLERKEGFIYDLVYGSDSRKRQVEGELRQIDQQNAKQIQANSDIWSSEIRTRVKRTVEAEGLFYEKVKLSLTVKGPDCGEGLVHTLQRQHATFFMNESTIKRVVAEGQPKPLDASIKEDSDIPRRKFKTKAEFELATLAMEYDTDLIYRRAVNELMSLLFFA